MPIDFLAACQCLTNCLPAIGQCLNSGCACSCCGGSTTTTTTDTNTGISTVTSTVNDGFKFVYKEGLSTGSSVSVQQGQTQEEEPSEDDSSARGATANQPRSARSRSAAEPGPSSNEGPKEDKPPIIHQIGDVVEAVTSLNFSPGNLEEALMQAQQVADIVSTIISNPAVQAGCMAMHDNCNEGCSAPCCCPGCGCPDGQCGCGSFGSFICQMVASCFGSNPDNPNGNLANYLKELSDQYGPLVMTMAVNALRISTSELETITLTSDLKALLQDACIAAFKTFTEQTYRIEQTYFYKELQATHKWLLSPKGTRVATWLNQHKPPKDISTVTLNQLMEATSLLILSSSSLSSIISEIIPAGNSSSSGNFTTVDLKALLLLLSKLNVCTSDDPSPYPLGAKAKTVMYWLCTLLQNINSDLLDDNNGLPIIPENQVYILINTILGLQGFIPLPDDENPYVPDPNNDAEKILASLKQISSQHSPSTPSTTTSVTALRYSAGAVYNFTRRRLPHHRHASTSASASNQDTTDSTGVIMNQPSTVSAQQTLLLLQDRLLQRVQRVSSAAHGIHPSVTSQQPRR